MYLMLYIYAVYIFIHTVGKISIEHDTIFSPVNMFLKMLLT